MRYLWSVPCSQVREWKALPARNSSPEADRSESAEAANIIGGVIRSTREVDEDAESEDEIVAANGVLIIPRLLDEEHLNRTLQTIGVTRKPEPQALAITHPLALAVGRPGLLDSLYFLDNDSVLAPLKAHEVLIDVKAASPNQEYVTVYADILLTY